MLYSMLNCLSFKPARTALSALSKAKGVHARSRRQIQTLFGKVYPNNNSKTNAKILRSYLYCLISDDCQRDSQTPLLSGPARIYKNVRCIIKCKHRIPSNVLLCCIPLETPHIQILIIAGTHSLLRSGTHARANFYQLNSMIHSQQFSRGVRLHRLILKSVTTVHTLDCQPPTTVCGSQKYVQCNTDSKSNL